MDAPETPLDPMSFIILQSSANILSNNEGRILNGFGFGFWVSGECCGFR